MCIGRRLRDDQQPWVRGGQRVLHRHEDRRRDDDHMSCDTGRKVIGSLHDRIHGLVNVRQRTRSIGIEEPQRRAVVSVLGAALPITLDHFLEVWIFLSQLTVSGCDCCRSASPAAFDSLALSSIAPAHLCETCSGTIGSADRCVGIATDRNLGLVDELAPLAHGIARARDRMTDDHSLRKLPIERIADLLADGAGDADRWRVAVTISLLDDSSNCGRNVRHRPRSIADRKHERRLHVHTVVAAGDLRGD
jgi:hypothetical protein